MWRVRHIVRSRAGKHCALALSRMESVQHGNKKMLGESPLNTVMRPTSFRWPGALFRLLAAGALLSVVAGCVFAQQDPLREVRVQLKWTHQFQFAGYYAAIQQGYYRDAGLDVKLIEYSPSSQPIDQLIGGRVDFCVADSGVLLYSATGVPLVALAAIFQHSPSVVMARDDGTITTLADFRGKRAMLPGGFMNAELMSMMETAGVRPDDLELVPGSVRIESLIEGQTDLFNGYITNEPFAMQQRGLPYLVFSPRDYGVDFYGDIILTTEAKIASDPELVRTFVDASIRGWRYAVDHPEAIVELILREYNTQGRSREHLMFEAREAIKLILPDLVPIGYMNEERWRRIEEVFRSQGQLAGPVDLSRMMYRPKDSHGFLDAFQEYKLEIAGALALLIGAGMAMPILRLRAQVRARTRDLEDAKANAEVEARTDELTCLPNRRCFLESLERDLSRAERYNAPLTVMSLDLDHFKAVNDRLGHAAGDEALRNVAAILARHVRSGDIAARMGGEELALSCLNTDLDEATRIAERLLHEVEGSEVRYGNACFRITVSIGLASRERRDDLASLLRKADQALYEAKRQGRNRVCVWNDDDASTLSQWPAEPSPPDHT